MALNVSLLHISVYRKVGDWSVQTAVASSLNLHLMVKFSFENCSFVRNTKVGGVTSAIEIKVQRGKTVSAVYKLVLDILYRA